jgi:hypothetical protein
MANMARSKATTESIGNATFDVRSGDALALADSSMVNALNLVLRKHLPGGGNPLLERMTELAADGVRAGLLRDAGRQGLSAGAQERVKVELREALTPYE